MTIARLDNMCKDCYVCWVFHLTSTSSGLHLLLPICRQQLSIPSFSSCFLKLRPVVAPNLLLDHLLCLVCCPLCLASCCVCLMPAVMKPAWAAATQTSSHCIALGHSLLLMLLSSLVAIGAGNLGSLLVGHLDLGAAATVNSKPPDLVPSDPAQLPNSPPPAGRAQGSCPLALAL